MTRSARLADTADFSILGPRLARDVEDSLARALEQRVVFLGHNKPLAIFRDRLSASIRDIEADRRGRLLEQFLRDGPYERAGPIPAELIGRQHNNEDAAEAVRFIYFFMINSFQGCRG